MTRSRAYLTTRALIRLVVWGALGWLGFELFRFVFFLAWALDAPM